MLQPYLQTSTNETRQSLVTKDSLPLSFHVNVNDDVTHSTREILVTNDHPLIQLLLNIAKEDAHTSKLPATTEALFDHGLRVDPWDLTPADMAQCMLYSAVKDPMSIREYLLPWSAKSSVHLDRKSCFMAHLRHELGSAGVERGLCDRLDYIVTQNNPVYLFWVFLLCMDVDVGIYHAVSQTFPGRPEVFQQIFSYVYNKIAKLLQSPFFPSTAGDIMLHMSNEVRRTLLENNRSKIIREGEPEPEKLSHPRELKKRRQQTAAAAAAAAKTTVKQRRKKARATKDQELSESDHQQSSTSTGYSSGISDAESMENDEISGTATPSSSAAASVSDYNASPYRDTSGDEEQDPSALRRYGVAF